LKKSSTSAAAGDKPGTLSPLKDEHKDLTGAAAGGKPETAGLLKMSTKRNKICCGR